MRALVLLAALAVTTGCYVYARPYPPAPPPPAAQPPPPGARLLTENEAVNIAFEAARQRNLDVNRVQHAHLDGAGRWHIDLRGHGDHAKFLIDARTGQILKGKFRESDADWGD